MKQFQSIRFRTLSHAALYFQNSYLFVEYSHSIRSLHEIQFIRCPILKISKISFRGSDFGVDQCSRLGFVNGCENGINISHISIAPTSHRHRWIDRPFVCSVEHVFIHGGTILCLESKNRSKKNREEKFIHTEIILTGEIAWLLAWLPSHRIFHKRASLRA